MSSVRTVTSRLSRLAWRLAAVAGVAVAVASPGPSGAAEPAAGASRCLVVEVFAPTEPADDAVVRAVEAFAAERRGVVVVRRFVDATGRGPAGRAHRP
jgi:hypothetical protein